MKIDIFNHIVPKSYFNRIAKTHPNVAKRIERASGIFPSLLDLDERFRIMDMFDEYVQVICYAVPPFEIVGPPPVSSDLARLANDGMAELVQKYPDRFLGFVGSLPMNDPEGLLAEANRAIKDLGAVGVQVYTNVLGKPLTSPETIPLFDLMAGVDRPIWIHPVRWADFPDYKSESMSHHEIWWTFGWPYETSVVMAHLVFSGLFDRHPDIKIITHHLGGMVPYFEGRIGVGWDHMGARTSWGEPKASKEESAVLLKKRPLDYFHLFYADTALFGAKEATLCGLKFFGSDRTLFGTDLPYHPKDSSPFVRWTIEIIDSLDIQPAERQAIYEGNIRRLLKLKK
jgi:aminocarboxymuconate-semialdehyde decarboxylase